MQIRWEGEFTKNIQQLFDIAHQKALQIMTIGEDKKFVIAQRDNRRGCMISVDGTTGRLKQNEKIQKRIRNDNKRNVKWRKLWILILPAMMKIATKQWIHWILWIVDIMHLLVLLTIFGSRVSFDENKAILENFKGKEYKTDPQKSVKLQISDNESIRTPSSFLTQRAKLFFDALGLPRGFLNKDP